MNIKVENIEKNVVQLEIEVDAEKFEEGMQKSFLKNVRKYNVPGFRKGKAPRKMIERNYGEQVFYEDAINTVCPEAYDEAVKENNLSPVERPEIDIKQIGSGQNLIFTAKVTLKPEVELGQYKGVEVNKVDVNVTDEDVEKELQKTAERNSRLISVEDRPAQSGDTVVIDFEGFIDDKPFEGGKAENFNLVIGSGQFIPGFEDQLVGTAKDAQVDVNVAFPEDYGSSELAGKPALFKVTVKEIKLSELPVIDDEFARDVSEFDTLEAYKEDMKKKLIDDAEHKAKHQTEDNVIDKVIENANVDIPQVMIERSIDGAIDDFTWRLRYQGLELDKYMEIMGMDMNALREQFRVKSQKDVKTQLIVEKIAETEKVEAADDEINEEIKKLAENNKLSEEEFRKHLDQDYIEYIKKNITARKTVDMLVSEAKII